MFVYFIIFQMRIWGQKVNMIRFLRWILRYIIFFLIFLGLTFLVQEIWNLFQYRSLLLYAGITTIVNMLIDLTILLVKRLNEKKN